MNIDLVAEIVELALSLTANQKDAAVADTLIQIVQKGVQAYSQYAGKPLDPALIKFEAPV